MSAEKKVKIGLFCLAAAIFAVAVWFAHAQEETVYQTELRTGVVFGMGLAVGVALFALRKDKKDGLSLKFERPAHIACTAFGVGIGLILFQSIQKIMLGYHAPIDAADLGLAIGVAGLVGLGVIMRKKDMKSK